MTSSTGGKGVRLFVIVVKVVGQELEIEQLLLEYMTCASLFSSPRILPIVFFFENLTIPLSTEA
jgi:hypothetical protein